MRSSHSLDRIGVVFDDARQVADAGLLLPATLAQHLGLRELVDRCLDLGSKPGRANVGDKLLSLVFSALAGGDCIVERNGRTWIPAPREPDDTDQVIQGVAGGEMSEATFRERIAQPIG